MPKEIRPLEKVAMIYYVAAHQQLDLVLHLKERKSLSLQDMFSNAREVEENLRACGKLVDQSRDEDLEQEQVCGQRKSYMGFHLL